ncbi:MAG TPA: flavin reductase family protein [Acidimicrobiales bacterium]|nr:flavin reductase family protein [Acidimicrobiales bacterium]
MRAISGPSDLIGDGDLNAAVPAQPGAAPTFDAARFRQVLGHFCSGVTVVTSVIAEEPVGFTVQSFSSVSLDPPLVAVCPARVSTSWPRIRSSGVFCVNVLREDQEAVARVFATRGADKFRGVGWTPSVSTRSPVLDGALAWIDCRIEAEHDGGDHLVVLGRAVGLDLGHEGRPLLFYRGGYGRFEH